MHRKSNSLVATALMLALIIDPSGGVWAAESTRISEGRMVVFTAPAGKTVSGRLYKEPPPVPENTKYEREYEERDGQLGEPWIEAGGPARISPVPATSTTDRGAGSAFTLIRNSQYRPSGGNVSNVAEPSVGSQGAGIFETYNWFATISTDNGQSRSYVSPYTLFPNSPAPFTASFCCDQRVMQVADRDLIFWFLQYSKTGTTSGDSGGVRVAMANGQAGLASNTWTHFGFTPDQLGLSGVWFDFPHMQASANFLYFTTNIFTTASNAYSGAAIFRIPLTQLQNNQPLTVSTYLSTSFGSIMAVHGAAADGTRPGRTTMYFASVSGSNSLVLLKWPEADAQPTITTVSGLSTTQGGSYTCTGPDSTNPCGRANTRGQGGWITDTEFGVAWTSAQIPPNRPFPFTRIAIFNPDTLALISEPDIWSATNAFLYPIFSVNEQGALGGVIDNLGGDTHPRVRAIIRDDLSPPVINNGWETFAVATGDAGAPDRWGDYNGVTPHERYPKTWLGMGRIQVGGTANSNAQVRSFWFGRERDARPTISVEFAGAGSGTVTSAPAGINCSSNCSAQFDLGTQLELTATGTGGANFTGWTGACTGMATCTIDVDSAATAIATFSGGGAIFDDGFESITPISSGTPH
jgi:hypothetical protein